MIGAAGLAPGVSVYALKTFQATFGGNTGATNMNSANAIDFARYNYNVDVINNSWSTTTDNAIISALSRARTLGRSGKGIVVVQSVGNDFANSIAFPSNQPDVVAVGAITSVGDRSPYSNKGTGISVVAPSSIVANSGTYCSGDGVPTASVTSNSSCYGQGLAAGYVRFGGTSAAAPQVAAVAAMVLARNPNLTSTQVRDRIRANADSWGPVNEVGYGKVNAYLAVVGRLAVAISGNTLVQPGVVTRTCSASGGEDPKSFRWYLSYSSDEASLFDTGVTSQAFSQTINSGESFLTRCVVTSGLQVVYAQKAMIAQ